MSDQSADCHGLLILHCCCSPHVLRPGISCRQICVIWASVHVQLHEDPGWILQPSNERHSKRTVLGAAYELANSSAEESSQLRQGSIASTLACSTALYVGAETVAYAPTSILHDILHAGAC